ncbi:putative veratrol:corrinoid protein metyltransferase [Treponema primitia ZAS-2]|uniref:Putative veratrol:corrinoid protein metyltransferase n=1 Tax=Treponema primitia (strain ATCC BAA-887 / DSM 12427 / ZAS-2) TaxID=545694 RepID=F5YIA7_TREPZ|nr:veratrol--corrinoid protein metyltransferase [Treponema primitia]AEF85625.1 putative veratrol:corrinoid protein metyltransferase [Treponema primitia ZAS-2]
MESVPFSKEELAVSEHWPPLFPGAPGAKKFKTPVTPRENYEALYKGELPHWLPLMADQCLLTPRIDPDNIARGMALEVNPLSPEELVGGKDKFGIEWIYVPQVGGSTVKPGNPALEDANDWPKVIKFPDISKWDWEGSAKANAAYTTDGRALTFSIFTGFYERLISFMDFENAVVALIDDDQKDAVKDLFDKLAELYKEIITNAKKQYNPLVINFHDDWGGQQAPFFSLATVQEMIVPYLKKVVDHVHSQGMYFDMHSCGKNELLVPAYIEAGCDSWGGAQSMNDKSMLYDKYGDKLIIGLDPDVALGPDTKTEDAVAAAKRFVAKYGPSMEKKSFLCSAMGTPPAFDETVYEESRKLFG